MTDLSWYIEFSSLPATLKKEISDFMQSLKHKKNFKSSKERKRKFGAAKGFFVIEPDFDAPLPDFKDYM